MKLRHLLNSLFATLITSLSPLFGWSIWTIGSMIVFLTIMGWIWLGGRERRLALRTSSEERKAPYAIEARYKVPGIRVWTFWTPWRVLWAFAMQAVRNAFLTELEKNNTGDAQYRPVDYNRRKEDKHKDYPRWR